MNTKQKYKKMLTKYKKAATNKLKLEELEELLKEIVTDIIEIKSKLK